MKLRISFFKSYGFLVLYIRLLFWKLSNFDVYYCLKYSSYIQCLLDTSSCRAKSLRTPSNLLVVNLAFCDFMMMLKAPIFIYNSFNCGFAMGHLGCQIFAFMGSLSGIGAGMTNAAIAYDRYRYSFFSSESTKFIFTYKINYAKTENSRCITSLHIRIMNSFR